MPAPPTPSRALAVQRLLTERCSAPVTVGGWQPLEPWAVARFRVEGAGAARTAIAKWVRPGTGRTARRESWRPAAECAALRFLAEDVETRLAPRVIAFDPAAGLLVLEDLAPRVALDTLLARDGAAAHAERLTAFARALGRLGAVTAGRADAYRSRRAALGPVDREAADTQPFADHRQEGVRWATVLGVPPGVRVSAELTRADAVLSEPGPFLALSNGDAEANNLLVHASGRADARLIDFEAARFTHALADAVCLYVPGPGWLSVGDPVASGLAGRHRHALAQGVPQAEDDRLFGFGLAAACLSWALIRLRRFPALDARARGDESRSQLVATLEAAARTASNHSSLPHLAGWADRIAATLRSRWPDADQDFTDPVRFPPYRRRG
ncbi:hypothetical protein [Streptomyces sp. NBC_00304]|uniref:hypothetical protein n=1 Tax=Streptomyces sp. NBC_00304 TaxID=2975706 RepID=UPI002E2B6E20|nr:hypothetical protein [Streptomyces sp. NBC_00304]